MGFAERHTALADRQLGQRPTRPQSFTTSCAGMTSRRLFAEENATAALSGLLAASNGHEAAVIGSTLVAGAAVIVTAAMSPN
jgi:hypothetical protein